MSTERELELAEEKERVVTAADHAVYVSQTAAGIAKALADCDGATQVDVLQLVVRHLELTEDVTFPNESEGA